MSINNPMDESPATFAGLEEWNKRLFEKLGWMHLAKSNITSKSNELKNFSLHKIKMYKKEVTFLGLAILNKYNSITENDRKSDLKILMRHNLVLQDAVANLLESINVENPKITPGMLDSDIIRNNKKQQRYNTIKNEDLEYNPRNTRGEIDDNEIHSKPRRHPVEIDENEISYKPRRMQSKKE